MTSKLFGFSEIRFSFFNFKGKLDRKNVEYVPPSHNEKGKAVGGVSLGTVLLVVGVILWAVGSLSSAPALILAGQIMFAIGFAPIAIAIVIISCACCLESCNQTFTKV